MSKKDSKQKDIEAIVKKTAELAKLEFPKKDLARLAQKARVVIAYVEQLSELATEGIEPTSHAMEIGAGLREDAVMPSDYAERIMDQAPARDEHFIQIPKVIEGE